MGALYPDVSVNFTSITCYKCGIPFGIPDYQHTRLLNNHEGFFCPNGHEQFFNGKTEAQKLKEQLEQKEKLLLEKERKIGLQMMKISTAEAERDHEKRRVTRLRRKLLRVHNGVCPCCQRTFQNLWRHMVGQHPEFKP